MSIVDYYSLDVCRTLYSYVYKSSIAQQDGHDIIVIVLIRIPAGISSLIYGGDRRGRGGERGGGAGASIDVVR